MQRQVLVYDGLQKCPYLEGKVARMPLFRQLRPLGWEAADERFASAERRVGRALYHTACPACRACQGIRIPVSSFVPTKSQRRVIARWPADGRVEIGPPTVTDEKVALFNLHKRSRGLAEPDDEPMDAASYLGWLAQSCFDTVEMRYRVGDRLVGVGVVDLGKVGASSVYFYFDPSPEVARLSPGVFSVLHEIEWCRRTGREHLYLGLYVEGCERLDYKADYAPHERLVDGAWRRFE